MADVSGRYSWSDASATPFTKETLRFDVDGRYPQMAASVSGTAGLQVNAHWVAQPLTATPTPTGTEWTGPILYKNGNTGLIPHSRIVLRLVDGKLRATFSGPGLPNRVRDYTFRSPFFRQVAFEFDAELGVNSVLDYQTHAHPDHPAALPNETLTIDTVFERAGIRVTRTGLDGVVPSTGAASNSAWSDNEMHDAMQAHFSRLANLPPEQRNRARWALWTFFAGRYEDEGSPDPSTGGIMFDSIGPAHRQGTALFLNSFISQAPAGDDAPEAWRRRMAFWTAVHEMGHAFNLLHAWQKHLGTPWLPQPSGFDQQTFMNYPFLYETGTQQNANTIRFFERFEFRFTDDELLFLRHAPERFVVMGGSDFGSNHALEQANVSPAPTLNLELRVNRKSAAFEFLEPVVIELKLTNTSGQPKLMADRPLKMNDQLTIVVQKRGGGQKTFHPYAHHCRQAQALVLKPDESLYESLFLSASGNGWLVDAPGYYSVQVCLHLPGEDVVSNSLTIRVAPPRNWDEEYIAQDFFSDEVGRALAFDGTYVLETANQTLHEITAKCADSQAAVHAQVALSMPRLRPFKLLVPIEPGSGAGRYRIHEVATDKSSALALLKILGQSPEQANRSAEALGHIDYRYYTERCMGSMEACGEKQQAQDLCRKMYDTFTNRKVLPRVLSEIAPQVELADAEEDRLRGRRRGSR